MRGRLGNDHAAYEAEVKTIARALSEVAHALEGADDLPARVRHALLETNRLVPYRRCSLLMNVAGTRHVFVVPDVDGFESAAIESRLVQLQRLVNEGDDIGRSIGDAQSMTVPLTGLERVVGVLQVTPFEDAPYEAVHLRLLSVVAAQLGAYCTMIELRDAEAQRARELEVAHEFQQLLTGIVSHDLRNPLAVIISVGELLLARVQDETQIRAVQRAMRSALQATRIINDLLDVTEARVSGTITVTKRPSDLRQLVIDAVEDARSAHGNRTIELDVSTLAELPVEIDPDRLAQAIGNLISNALAHGQPTAPIRIELLADADTATIRVHNWGAPIPSDRVAGLFDPFRSGVRERRKGGGLGLGLYIVSQIAHAHGGRIDVTSTSESGTTFSFTVPRNDQATTPSKTSPSPKSHDAILVVDDDEDVRLALSAVLEKQGYQVATAANGQDALRLLREGLHPQLVLLDLNMPVMDGESFYQACKHDPELDKIPILILSADTVRAVKLSEMGAQGVLSKPVGREALLRTLGDLVH